MAYSRWGGSCWHTFWCVHPSGEKETSDNALFEICGLCQFTAKELRDDIETCLNTVRDIASYADNEKIDELRTYIAEFLEDVKIAYPTLFRKINRLIVDTWNQLRWNLLSKAKKEQVMRDYGEALKKFYLPILGESLSSPPTTEEPES